MRPLALGAGLLVCAGLPAQERPAQEPKVEKPWEWGHAIPCEDGDAVDIVVSGGLRFTGEGLEVRAESAVIRVDRDEFKELLTRRPGHGLPVRGMPLPDARRTLSPQVLSARLDSFLRSLGRDADAPVQQQKEWLDLVRSVYLAGDITVVEGDTETVTAESLHFSVQDNRAVFKGVQMRLVSHSRDGARTELIVRADKLVKQGVRTTGRDVSVTTCTAGKPHFEVLSGQIEIIERGDEFEIRSTGNALAFSGNRMVPLPDARFFTGDQTQVPLKGLSAAYRTSERLQLGVDFGQSMNDSGGALHSLLTGRPAGEFRGEWRAGVNYNEVRGFPLEGDLSYRGGDLYEGRTHGFYLDDDGGENREFIKDYPDGTPITEKDRNLLRTENRVFLADDLTLDLTVFSAGDPAVYSEFHKAMYNDEELPETSVYLRHGRHNRLATLTGRVNLTDFAYGDDRGLADSFREELPVLTYDVFSQPLFSVGGVDALLTSETDVGQRRNEVSSNVPLPVPTEDETFRFDQKLELATPFHLGVFAVRPYAAGRFTYYDDTVSGESAERLALDAGISATTRIARAWTLRDADGAVERVQHAVYPTVSFGHLFQVDDEPSELHQFDEIDSLNENGVVRLGVLQRFHRSRRGRPFDPDVDHRRGVQRDDTWLKSQRRTDEAREFLFLDLAQNLFPIADRDNAGERLGLFEYEMIWRPMAHWIPVPNLRLLFEGEHDWRTEQARTLNTALRFGKVLGVNWHTGYRTDAAVKGAVQYGADTDVMGRFTLTAGGAYDLDAEEELDYTVQLIRRDHDWWIRMGVSYSVVRDETSFSINFDPVFGGLFRQQPLDYSGLRTSGVDSMLDY